jgi:hypothetical protein
MNFGNLNGSHSRKFPADDMWCIENRFENGECCLDAGAGIRDFLSSSVPRGSKAAPISHKYPQLALLIGEHKPAP